MPTETNYIKHGPFRLFYVLAFFCLLFSPQSNVLASGGSDFLPISTWYSNHYVCPAISAVADDADINDSRTVTSHKSDDDKKSNLAHRKRGITSYFIKRPAQSLPDAGEKVAYFAVKHFNAYQQLFQRPLYYVYLFRYALF